MAIRDQLADFCSNIEFEDIPPDVIEFSKLCIMDEIGLAIAGARMIPDEDHIDIAKLFRDMGGKEESSLIGEECKIPCLNAAFSNTAVGCYGGGSAYHLVPATIAVAEREHTEGKALILAAAIGGEIIARVNKALGAPCRGFHSPSLCTSFGCAVAAGKLLGLEQDILSESISIAAVQGAGFHLLPVQPKVPDVERFQLSGSAQGGVMAALMAQMGTAGIAEIFEDPRGFLSSYSLNPNHTKLTEGLGSTYEIKNVSMKRYSIGRPIIAAVDLLLEILEKNRIHAENIERITCKLPSRFVPLVGATGYPVISGVIPEVSARYILAVSACQREKMMFSMEHVKEASLKDPRHLELFKRIDVLAEPELDEKLSQGKQHPCILTVRTKDGKEYSQLHDGPVKGDPAMPLSRQEMETKFTKFVTPVLGQQRCDRIIDTLRRLEDIDDISDMARTIAAG